VTDTQSKKQSTKIFSTCKKLFQIILYIPIQIIFIPFAIIGVIVGIFREMVIGQKLGVSFSAIKALQYRWAAHYFDLRPDTLSVAFIKKLPCESHFGLWSILGALIIAKRLFGFTTAAVERVEPEETFDATAVTRVRIFDRIMEKHLDDVEQIVLPGAGLDLIALHHTNGKDVKVFELDQVDTLNVKVETLKKAGLKHDWINFIPVDYANESWTDKLLEAGFDKTKKTLFLWQSVSLFLDEDIVKDSLTKMADLCVAGSVIAQDFYSQAFLSGEISKPAKKQFNVFEKMGESARFGVDMSGDAETAVKNFLAECGLKMTDYIQFGKNIGIDPFYCIVEAEKLK
jgi:methyltransferase (TIGR00027 family)